jgi:Enoyl-(Acyl carrier protein) reductase
VNAVAPGFIEDTDFNCDFPADARAGVVRETPLGRTGSVADVVAAVRYLSSSEASFVTGEILHVNGGRAFGRQPHPANPCCRFWDAGLSDALAGCDGGLSCGLWLS